MEKWVERTFEVIQRIRASGTTILMVEQNAYAALEMCDYAYVLESGSRSKAPDANCLTRPM
jgi:branched-chain amino acid transport system ATP-binding protein